MLMNLYYRFLMKKNIENKYKNSIFDELYIIILYIYIIFLIIIMDGILNYIIGVRNDIKLPKPSF